MLVTGEQVSGLPREAIVGHVFLQAERADLGGLVGEEKAAAQTWCKSWLWDGSVVRGSCWLEILGRFIGIFEDGKEFEVCKWCREAMQGHLIEDVLAQEEQI
jgi:hypothetical protein